MFAAIRTAGVAPVEMVCYPQGNMPWRHDFIEARWLDPDFGLAGFPERIEPPDTEKRPGEAEKRRPSEPKGEHSWVGRELIPHDAVPPLVEAVQVPNRPSPWKESYENVLFLRDRIGFRYERIVGLDDCVSQREAAQLLRVPTMRINRWVRGEVLPSNKKSGYSVIRLRDLVELAKSEKLPIEMLGQLWIKDTDSIERTWIKSDEVQYEQSDEG